MSESPNYQPILGSTSKEPTDIQKPIGKQEPTGVFSSAFELGKTFYTVAFQQLLSIYLTMGSFILDNLVLQLGPFLATNNELRKKLGTNNSQLHNLSEMTKNKQFMERWNAMAKKLGKLLEVVIQNILTVLKKEDDAIINQLQISAIKAGTAAATGANKIIQVALAEIPGVGIVLDMFNIVDTVIKVGTPAMISMMMITGRLVKEVNVAAGNVIPPLNTFVDSINGILNSLSGNTSSTDTPSTTKPKTSTDPSVISQLSKPFVNTMNSLNNTIQTYFESDDETKAAIREKAKGRLRKMAIKAKGHAKKVQEHTKQLALQAKAKAAPHLATLSAKAAPHLATLSAKATPHLARLSAKAAPHLARLSAKVGRGGSRKTRKQLKKRTKHKKSRKSRKLRKSRKQYKK